MKWLIVAVYLSAGSAEPTMETRQMPDKAACRALAEEYVKQAVVGQARAFCLKLKEK